MRNLHQSHLLLLSPLLVVFALILSGCSAEGSGPTRPLNAEELRGRDVFQADCSQCHNAYKKEPLQGPPLVGVFRKKELPSGIPATDQHVRDTIMIGRRNMPPFNGMLDDRQLSELMTFLHTL